MNIKSLLLNANKNIDSKTDEVENNIIDQTKMILKDAADKKNRYEKETVPKPISFPADGMSWDIYGNPCFIEE